MFWEAGIIYFQDPRGFSDPVPGKFRGFQIPVRNLRFDTDIIASPMARESLGFRFLLFLSKTLVFYHLNIRNFLGKIGNRNLKSAELSWNRIRTSTWMLKI